MATQRQIDANRRNAQQSTGPVTPQGKQTSSLNALKSGLYANTEVLPWESKSDYEDLVDTMYSQHAANSALARHYLDEVISCMWEVRRIRRSQAELHIFAYDRQARPSEEFPSGQVIASFHKVFSTTQWRLDSVRRALEAARRNLAEVQATDAACPPPESQPAVPEPEPAPAPVIATPATDLPKIGFVPKPPSSAIPEPLPAAPEPLSRLL